MCSTFQVSNEIKNRPRSKSNFNTSKENTIKKKTACVINESDVTPAKDGKVMSLIKNQDQTLTS